jgi:hypothetical protein
LLFEHRFASLIVDGSVTVTFRRWRRRQALAGRRYRTPGGIIEVDDIREVDPARISALDARRSGYPSAAAVRHDLRGDPGSPVYRIAFHAVAGPDPRAELAANTALTTDDVAEITKRLDRLDRASSHGPWTRAVLDVIAAHLATRAPDLAASFGRETTPFKIDVRKLKNLGLTISLTVGYRLSPRAEAYRNASGAKGSGSERRRSSGQ